MSEVKRFRADHRHVVETEFDDAQYVGVADYDAAQYELASLREELASLGAYNYKLNAQYERMCESHLSAEQRNTELESKLHKLSDFARFVIKCVRRNGEYAPLSMQEPHEIEALLAKPTESGASE